MNILISIFLFALGIFLLDWFLSAKGHRGPGSDHFDGRAFINYGTVKREFMAENGKLAVLKWLLTRRKNKWVWQDSPKSAKPKEHISGKKISVTFINHATVLIQTAGLNILTDPVWSKRTSPFSFFGPKRHRAPGIPFEDLPPIDIVLLSHNHYDHMDLPTLRRVYRNWQPKIINGLGNSEFLAERGVLGGTDIDWWQEFSIDKQIKITCVPAQHFSSRAVSDRNKTLWCGFMIHTPAGLIYFAGDTGYGPFTRKIGERFKKIRLAFIPIGAFLPEWFMKPVHVSPEEAFKIHKELNIQTSIGIHFGTFRLADDGQNEGPERIKNLVANSPPPKPDFRVLQNGETIIV